MIRVVVADDSPTVREMIVSILEADPEIQVVGQAATGAEAVELAARHRPDLITMDIHMPVMGGFEATKRIMTETPTPILVVSSSARVRDVELTMEAIRAGALMAIETPDPGSPEFTVQRQQLVAMTKAMAAVKVVRQVAAPAPPPRRGPALRPQRAARLVAMATSTGGPAALHGILRRLDPDFPAPIVVVQHIASGFVEGLAEWLGAASDLAVTVARPGDVLQPGTVYLAPDGRHLGIEPPGRIAMSAGPPIDGFRPSATHLFRTAARVYGPAVVGVVLTGMGSDGVEGLREVKAAGGVVLAQDEGSSVVYGMPREAVKAGVVDLQLPLAEIAFELTRIAGRRE